VLISFITFLESRCCLTLVCGSSRDGRPSLPYSFEPVVSTICGISVKEWCSIVEGLVVFGLSVAAVLSGFAVEGSVLAALAAWLGMSTAALSAVFTLAAAWADLISHLCELLRCFCKGRSDN
jgi:hypothetical protein